jgi:hypothetical protein
MARFAGDYFGISLGDEPDRGSSKLLSYFPSLRNTYRKDKEDDSNEPKQYGGKQAAPVFGGFQPNLGAAPTENERSRRSGMAFGGAKPGEF